MIELNADGTFKASPHYHRRELDQMARTRNLAAAEAHGWWLLIDANGDVAVRSRDFNELFWELRKNTLATATPADARLSGEEAALVAEMTARAVRHFETIAATAEARGDQKAAAAARQERGRLDALIARLKLTVVGFDQAAARDNDSAWAALAPEFLRKRADVEAAEELAVHLRVGATGTAEERLMSDAARVLAILAGRLRAARGVARSALTLASGIGCSAPTELRRTVDGFPIDEEGGR